MPMRKIQERNAHEPEQTELKTKIHINKAAEAGYKN